MKEETVSFTADELKGYTGVVVASERERCAKIAEEMNHGKRMGRTWQGWNAEIAHAIRNQ